MRFTVVWQPHAEQELAEIWQQSANREAVSAAANRMEQLLRTCPDRVGEERSFVDRIFFEGPLGMRFRLLFDDRVVQVLSVWDITRR